MEVVGGRGVHEVQKRSRNDLLTVWEFTAKVSRQLPPKCKFGSQVAGQNRREPLNEDASPFRISGGYNLRRRGAVPALVVFTEK